MAEWIPLLLPALIALAGWLANRWLHGRHEDRKAAAAADREVTEVRLLPLPAWQTFADSLQERIDRLEEALERADAKEERLRARISTLEGEVRHAREELSSSQERIDILEDRRRRDAELIAELTTTQKRTDVELSSLRQQVERYRQGVAMLIAQIVEHDLAPVWTPDNGENKRSDKT